MNLIRLVIVTLPVLLFGGVLALFNWIGRLHRRNRALDAIARRFHGISLTRSLCPQVRFPYFGGGCTLGIQTNRLSHRGISTFIQLPWDDRKLSLEIASKPLVGAIRKSRFFPIQTGDTEFDRLFSGQCNDREFVTRSLDENFRWRFRELAKHAGADLIALRIDHGHLSVIRYQTLSEQQELEDFLRLSLQVTDHLKAAQIRGIEFINQNKATVLDDVICPVCSEPVADEMVICVRCKTPHCHDCWDYNSSCATFACGEKRFFSTDASSRK